MRALPHLPPPARSQVKAFDAGPKWWQDVAHRVDQHVIRKLDKFRAVFRGKQQRRAMARCSATAGQRGAPSNAPQQRNVRSSTLGVVAGHSR